MNSRSITLVLFCIAIIAIGIRWTTISPQKDTGFVLTTWDAFGYYMSLPGGIIYHDLKDLRWVEAIDSQYNVLGARQLYQASWLAERGNYTNKYLIGVAVLQSPFFLMGHLAAHLSGAKIDGFSPPYQYAMAFGAILWAMIGLWFLGRFLLVYFESDIVAWALIFMGLCSNWLQYVAIDGAQSHVYLFTLYAYLLWRLHCWEQRPNIYSAFPIGIVIGLLTIGRPTEAISIFLPLLWLFGSTIFLRKVPFRKEVWPCLLGFGFGGLLGILPQLIFWKYTTGSWIYDVGSKWQFLDPWWRVLIGPQKGWLLYTPIAIFMLLGLLFLKKFPFRKSLIVFSVLNIWIIISWSDWAYGGSYSARALVQSYPIFTVCLAAFLSANKNWPKYIWWIMLIALSSLNAYQMVLYNQGATSNFSPLLRFLTF